MADFEYARKRFDEDEQRYKYKHYRQRNDDSTHIVIPLETYYRLEEEKKFKYQKLEKLQNEQIELNARITELEAELKELKEEYPEGHILTDSEWNGYNKALEIIKNKSLAQVDKSKVDEYGYTPLFYGTCTRYINKKPYIVKTTKKETPYSIKMDLYVVEELIIKDLNEQGFCDIDEMELMNKVSKIKTLNGFEEVIEIIRAERIYKGRIELISTLVDKDKIEGYRELYEWLNEEYGDRWRKNNSIVYEMSLISNIGIGKYIVEYKTI